VLSAWRLAFSVPYAYRNTLFVWRFAPGVLPPALTLHFIFLDILRINAKRLTQNAIRYCANSFLSLLKPLAILASNCLSPTFNIKPPISFSLIF